MHFHVTPPPAPGCELHAYVGSSRLAIMPNRKLSGYMPPTNFSIIPNTLFICFLQRLSDPVRVRHIIILMIASHYLLKLFGKVRENYLDTVRIDNRLTDKHNNMYLWSIIMRATWNLCCDKHYRATATN